MTIRLVREYEARGELDFSAVGITGDSSPMLRFIGPVIKGSCISEGEFEVTRLLSGRYRVVLELQGLDAEGALELAHREPIVISSAGIKSLLIRFDNSYRAEVRRLAKAKRLETSEFLNKRGLKWNIYSASVPQGTVE